jgi:hypothetical protein
MRIQFTRDGQHVAALVAERHLSILRVDRGEQRRIELTADARMIAAFTDQIWAANASGDLVRVALDGRVLGEHRIACDDMSIAATSIGSPAALLRGRTPSLALDDLGTLKVVEVEADAFAPVAGRRYVRVAGSRVALPSGANLTLPARPVAAHVLFDGAALAIATHNRQLFVISLASGRVQQRFELAGEIASVAAARGVIAVRLHDRIELVDARFGRSLGAFAESRELSLDGHAERVACRDEDGRVEVSTIASRIARRASEVECTSSNDAATSECEAADVAVDERSEPERVDETPGSNAPVDDIPARPPVDLSSLDVTCLVPRAERVVASRGEALRELDRELSTVMLRTLRAIAHAWDTRRIGYGNEGMHPYEHEVAALVGMNRGFATEHVAAAEQALADHERELAADPLHRSATMPTAELAAELGLSPASLEILLVVAAPALHGDVARLYGVLANDPHRALVDQRLVEQILDGKLDRHAIAAELHPRSPLVALGIVRAGTARGPFAGLEIDPVILARLRGETPELGMLEVRVADRGLDELDISRDVLAGAFDQLARAKRPARVIVRGRLGSGRRTLLAALARTAHRALGLVDALQLPREPERFARELKLALRRAQLAGLVPVICALEDVTFEGRDTLDVARDVCAAHPGPLAIIGSLHAAAPFPAGHIAIDLPVATEGERIATWRRALAGTGLWLRDEAGVAARYRIGPGTIYNAVASLGDHDRRAPIDERVDAYLRQAREVHLAEYARRVDRLATWSDLVLPPDIMDSVRELIGRVRHRKTVFETWGMSRTMATSRGLTALFQGQPGTGKTLVAGAIARELGLDLYQVDLSKVMSKWIGETERNLAKIFDAAEDGQIILLFDEADSLFAKRTEVRSSNDRYANLEVNYLLQRLDAFEGIAILTTNSGGSIDPAFKRRLSFRLSFPFPDEDTRAELWRAHLPRELPRDGELTFDVLARKYQLSGGYIRNACLRAAFLAAQEETSLQQHHLERAVALEFTEMGKLSTTGAID